jgi:hypothetical protein
MNLKKTKSTFYTSYLLFFFFLACSFNSFSQNKKCTIFFNDGTRVSGLGKIKIDNFIKFKLNEDAESTIYDPKSIDKITINENGLTESYKYKKEKGAFHKWLKVIIEGKVNLYKNDISGFYFNNAASPSGFGTGMPMGMGMTSHVTYFYIDHEKDAEVFTITSFGNISKNFKKAASDFFKDCPALVEKINNKTLEKDDIEEVVNYYNENCNNSTIETIAKDN